MPQTNGLSWSTSNAAFEIAMSDFRKAVAAVVSNNLMKYMETPLWDSIDNDLHNMGIVRVENYTLHLWERLEAAGVQPY